MTPDELDGAVGGGGADTGAEPDFAPTPAVGFDPDDAYATDDDF